MFKSEIERSSPRVLYNSWLKTESWWQSTPVTRSERLYFRAKLQFEDGNADAALATLDKLCKRYPESAAAGQAAELRSCIAESEAQAKIDAASVPTAFELPATTREAHSESTQVDGAQVSQATGNGMRNAALVSANQTKPLSRDGTFAARDLAFFVNFLMECAGDIGTRYGGWSAQANAPVEDVAEPARGLVDAIGKGTIGEVRDALIEANKRLVGERAERFDGYAFSGTSNPTMSYSKMMQRASGDAVAEALAASFYKRFTDELDAQDARGTKPANAPTKQTRRIPGIFSNNSSR